MQTMVFLEQDSLPGTDLSSWQQLPVTLHCYQSTAASEVLDRALAADILVVNKVRLDAMILAQLPRLKLICVTATGVNNVDLVAAKRLGIRVCNARDYALQAVPQHAMALLLSLVNQVIPYQQAIQAGRWSQSSMFCLLDYPIRQLAGQTFCVVGYGGLGKATAQLAAAFGMKVVIAERPNAEVVRPGRVSFQAALKQADVLSLHCPATDENYHLLNAERLSWLQPHAILINTARGSLIDAQALATALRQGRLAAAGLDVLDIEPPPADHPLLASDIPGLLLSPHVGWASQQAMQTLIAQTTENIQAYLHGQAVRVCH
jgi:glycerate dehydrogenase